MDIAIFTTDRNKRYIANFSREFEQNIVYEIEKITSEKVVSIKYIVGGVYELK